MKDNEIFQALVDSGKLTEADIREIFGLTEDMKNFIALLQMLLGPEDGVTYHKEANFADCWTSPVHMKWIELAEKVLKTLELSALDGLNQLSNAYNIIQNSHKHTLLFIGLYVYPDQLEELFASEVRALLTPALDSDPS